MDDQAYLEQGFDPNTLTVPRLRSILVAHNVNYPSSAKKGQLIELFTEHVVPHARKIKTANARVKRTSRGIEDITTGRRGTGAGDEDDDDDDEIPPTPATTRSSRRSTRARTEEAQDVDPTPRSSRYSTAPPENTPRAVPGKHSRTVEAAREEPAPKRTSTSRTRSRLSSVTPVAARTELAEDESPFSNQNVFQSGGSPPLSRAPDTDRRRTTLGPARSTSTARDLERRARELRRRTEEVKPLIQQTDGAVVPARRIFEVPVPKQQEVDVDTTEEFTPEEQQELVQAQVSGEMVPARQQTKTSSGAAKAAKTGVGSVLTVILAAVAGLWGQEKFNVGFCGVGQPSADLGGYEIPPSMDFARPQCEPCPPHAICLEKLEMECEKGFVLTHHPFSLNGVLPLPPTCEPDSANARRVNAVKERAIEALRNQNAKYECGEASSAELKEPELKSTIAKKRNNRMSNEEFEDLWASAMGEIREADEVVSGSDG